MEVEALLTDIKNHCIDRERIVEKRFSAGSEKFLTHGKDIEALQERERLQNGTLQRIEEGLQELRIEMLTILQGRPTWAVVYIIGFLLSISTGLAVRLITM